MKGKLYFALLWLLAATAMAQKAGIKTIRTQRIEITSAFDTNAETETAAIISKYKEKVDDVISPTLGLCLNAMDAKKPESLLGNWAADVMVETSTATGMEKADMGLFNIGGLRSSMPEGVVRAGDIYNISPFENHVVVLEMKGKHVAELMRNIAAVMGEGVSAGVRMEISAEGELLHATIDGKPIDRKKTYRIATIDYLAEGNDKMYALKKHKTLHHIGILAREAMIESIIKNRTIGNKIEGRIVIK